MGIIHEPERLGPNAHLPQFVVVKMLEAMGGAIVFDAEDVAVGVSEESPSLEMFTNRDPWQLIVRIAK